MMAEVRGHRRYALYGSRLVYSEKKYRNKCHYIYEVNRAEGDANEYFVRVFIDF